MTPISTIVVAVDASPNATAALEVAGSLATATGAELVVVHALGLLEEARAEAMEDEVRSWCAPLRDAGVAHRVEVVPGSPVPVLLAAASRLGAGLVVVGSRGVGGAASLGSTGHGLVEECAVPVLVVPPPDRRR